MHDSKRCDRMSFLGINYRSVVPGTSAKVLVIVRLRGATIGIVVD
jgi:hypothetical protein